MEKSEAMHKDTDRFSLKDYLFNKEKVAKITSEISAVHPTFKSSLFRRQVLAKFPSLELMERVHWIRSSLRQHLPQDYKDAVAILLLSLPPESDPSKSDDDFGDFIYSPYSYFVSEYGCTKKDLQFSLDALETLTTRFSAEGPIRFFINAFPEETVERMQTWTTHSHYHVRRLASEGTRPSLPWAKKIEIHHTKTFPILHSLHSDRTRFVTRSVANHVNDISKIDATDALWLLKKWQKSKVQNTHEMQFITKHSLRTLVKRGNKEALALLGYEAKKIKVKDFTIHTPKVRIGGTLEFSFEVVSIGKKPQQLMIDYLLYFRKANGTLSPKTFKIAKKTLQSEEKLRVTKKHPLKRMTTRTLYPGRHEVALQINGMLLGTQSFTLEE